VREAGGLSNSEGKRSVGLSLKNESLEVSRNSIIAYNFTLPNKSR